MRDANKPEIDFLCDVPGGDVSLSDSRFSHLDTSVPAIMQMKEVEADIANNRDRSIYKMKMHGRQRSRSMKSDTTRSSVGNLSDFKKEILTAENGPSAEKYNGTRNEISSDPNDDL